MKRIKGGAGEFFATELDALGFSLVPCALLVLGMVLALGQAAATEGEPAMDGVQIWTCGYTETVNQGDFSGPNYDKVKPLALMGVRNGVFSGWVAATCSMGPIEGLKATASDLVSADGKAKIPVSCIQVRFARKAAEEECGLPPYRFDALLPAAPDEIPMVDLKSWRQWKPRIEGPVATMPIWVTVRIPADAQAGEYAGALTVTAAGNPKIKVPLTLKVFSWTLPAPKDFRITHLDYPSAESTAKHYELELWSDKHFEYMGKSLALMAEVGARRVWMDLAINWAGGNDESVVRWIKNADGTYRHDFTVFDKYLDAVDKSIGKPFPLRLNCWGQIKADKEGKIGWFGPNSVTLLDPESGKLEPLEMPPPTESMQECEAFWRPVLLEMRKKIEARGWLDVSCLGYNDYAGIPTPATVSMVHRIWPDAVWSNTCHGGAIATFHGVEKEVTMRCLYGECVWTEGRPTPRGYRALLNREPKAGLWCADARCRHGEMYNKMEMAIYRNLPEEVIMRGHDGVGQLGVDFFPFKSGRGKKQVLGNNRGGTGPVNSTQALLAPGPEGPVGTERYEMFREGVQIGEALLFLERTLKENKISGKLAEEVNAELNARGEGFLKHFADCNVRDDKEPKETAKRIGDYRAAMRERDRKLFELCEKVAAALGGK